MKILYLHQYFTTRKGAGGTRSYEFARLLRKQGHDVTVICCADTNSGLGSPSGKVVRQYELEGVKILQGNVPYDSRMGNWKRLLVFASFMGMASCVAVRHGKVDVIYATSTPLTIAVPAILASRIRGCPFVFEVRDLWPEVPIGLGILRNRLLIELARRLERLAYHSSVHVVACSPGMKEGIVRTGVKEEKVTVIPNCCDNDLFDVPVQAGISFISKHPYLRHRLLVAYTGALGRVNGLDYLVRLAERVLPLDEKIAFLLVGSGPEKERLISLASKFGVLNRNLWLMQEVPRQEVPGIVSAATVMVSTVIPSPVMWNNSANKFFDSLAGGRPIAINHGGWLADLLIESGAGIVLPPDDLDTSAKRLVQFLRSEADLKRARQAARRLAAERFDRNHLAAQLEQVLLKAASAV